MQLPNADRALIDDVKVRDYLLSPTHPVGRYKARVFVAAGYQRDNWQRLRDDLAQLALTGDASLVGSDRFGQRWTTVGALSAPKDPLRVLVVWLIPSEVASPRLITAYPSPP
jgi:hypothetical protein